ncbi:MAG: sulfate permease [Chloroflexota bacterium]
MNWLLRYHPRDLPGDLIAGVTVAVMLVPQSMAYAALAGLPPVVGLYASILPVMIYGLFGSSRVLTLGPTAITSVMTLGAIAHLAENDAQMVSLALTLALLLGVVYLLMGVLRLGVIINLLSDPVLMGYVNAAALIILISQLPSLFGLSVERNPQAAVMLWQTMRGLPALNLATLLLGIISIALLIGFRGPLDAWLAARGIRPVLRVAMTRSGALFVTVLMTVIVFAFRLDTNAGVTIIGEIPRGLPELTMDFSFAQWRSLLFGAVAIAFVGFMEGISTAKSLISRKQQTVRPNQELAAMGLANISAAFTGGMPVTTSISRSAVNFYAGANTGLSSIVAGALMALTTLFLTPLFFYLPRVALAAIILTSVITLFDLRRLRDLWAYSPPEAAISLLTLVSVFVVGIEWGILAGVGATVALYVVRSSRMEITELGRIGYSDFYDDIRREDALPIDTVLIIRLDESLYFANSRYMDTSLRNLLASRRDVRYLVLVCHAVNTVDASAVQVILDLVREFSALNIQVYLAGLKGHAFRRLKAAHIRDLLGNERFHETTHAAVQATGKLFDDVLPI